VKNTPETYQATASMPTGLESFSLWTDFALLVKFRLSMLVVITSIGAFYVSSGLKMSLLQLVTLGLGGFLITAASNIINQVLEKDFDALMNRTQRRPIVQNKLSVSTAVLMAGLFCLSGITLLAMFNPITSFFGMFAFVLYAFVYTPLKRYSRIAVFIGAIAGAMPMLIGSVAFFGGLTELGICLFLIQLAWQFPHFWAIAFLSFEDYDRAGFSFIPKDEDDQIDKSVATSSIAYAALLVALTGYMYMVDVIGLFGFVALLLVCVSYLIYSIQFYRLYDEGSAKRLMLSSFAYMPMVLFILIIDLLF
jgi:protoheme IX farnesyltransferase